MRCGSVSYTHLQANGEENLDLSDLMDRLSDIEVSRQEQAEIIENSNKMCIRDRNGTVGHSEVRCSDYLHRFGSVCRDADT